MALESVSTTKRPVIQFLNIFLMVANLWLALVLGSTYWSEEIPILPIAEFFKRRELAIIPILLIIYMIFKEFRGKPVMKKFYITLIIFAVQLIQSFCLNSFSYTLFHDSPFVAY